MPVLPKNPQEVQSALYALALTGQVRADCNLLPWLVSVRLSDQTGKVDPRWLDFLPAASERDLLRIGLLRDPCYRWHLDCGIAAATTVMAQAGNWHRLEEILTGPLKASAAVIAAILLAQQVRTGRQPNELQTSDWTTIDPPGYAEWDLHLWGHSRIVEALPVIIESYPRFLKLAVGWNAETNVASGLIPTQGCSALTVIDRKISPKLLTDLYRAGCPITPSTISGGQPPSWSIIHNIDGDLPNGLPTVGNLWDAAEGLTVLALPGIEGLDDPIPPLQASMEMGRRLPSAIRLRDLEQQAVLAFAADPVHGLLLQLLIQDSLDGELGQDRIALCPILEGNQASVVGNTVILYRPMDQSQDLSRPMKRLGRFNDVMQRLANCVSLRSIPVLTKETLDPWTAAFTRMIDYGWITENGQRWHLEERVTDRLHGEGFMHEVIRRARVFREQRMLPALKSLWDTVESGNV